MSETECPICSSAAAVESAGADIVEYRCQRCGQYKLTGSGYKVCYYADWTPRQVANASGWVREHQGALLSSREVERLRSLATPIVSIRAMKVLRELGRRSENIGDMFDFELADPSSIAQWLAVSWTANAGELAYLFSFLLRLNAIEGKQRLGQPLLGQSPSFKLFRQKRRRFGF